MEFSPLFLFQDVVLDGADAGEKSQSFFEIIMNSGFIGILIILALFVLSAIAVYIFIERYLTIKRASEVDEGFMASIRESVQNSNIESAIRMCQNTDSPVAKMIGKGLMRIGKPLNDVNAAIENVGNLEVIKLEKNLSTLATISGAAPMIGFFGTVTGMISAFYEMSTQQNVTPDVLAGGIYQALITTACGLFVGIIAFVGYNYLVSLVEKVIFQMEALSSEFMDLLQEPA